VRDCAFSLTDFNRDMLGTNANLMELLNGH
jgi:urea carboxylase